MSLISDKKLSLTTYLCKHVGMPSSLFHGETLIVELAWKVVLVGSPSHEIFYIQHYQDEGSGSNTTLIQHHMSHTQTQHMSKNITDALHNIQLLVMFVSAVPDIL